MARSTDQGRETCPFLAGVQDYLDGLLSDSEKSDFENHLPGCPECTRSLEAYRQVSAVLKEAASARLPALDRERVYAGAVSGPGRMGWWLAAAGAAAAVLLLFVLWPRNAPVSTYPESRESIHAAEPAAWLEAAVTYMSADASGPVEAGGRLIQKEGAEACAGRRGALAMRVADGVSVVLLMGGRATFQGGPDGSLRVSLTQGALVARLRSPLERRFLVETPAGSVEATGTVFAVRILQDGNTEVWLYRGRVRIHPGMGISHERGAPAHAVFSPRVLERVDDDLSSGLGILEDARRKDPWGLEPLAWLSIKSRPAGAEVSADEVVLGHTPLLMARPAERLELGIAAEGYQPVRRSVELKTGSRSSHRVELAPTRTPAGDPLGRIRRLLAARRIEKAVLELEGYLEKKPGDVKALFLLADARRLDKKPEEALALYRKVGETAWDHRLREAAMYEVGRLQLHALSRPAAALETFLKLEREYPRGLMGQEVAYHLAESYIATRRFSEAVGALEDYLKRFPRGTKAKDARTLLEALKKKGWR